MRDLLGDVLRSYGDRGWVHVNLIPLNPTPGSKWTASDPADEREFVRRLAAKGIPTTVRDTRGREIDGACGQLAATEVVTPRTWRPPRRHGCGSPTMRRSTRTEELLLVGWPPAFGTPPTVLHLAADDEDDVDRLLVDADARARSWGYDALDVRVPLGAPEPLRESAARTSTGRSSRPSTCTRWTWLRVARPRRTGRRRGALAARRADDARPPHGLRRRVRRGGRSTRSGSASSPPTPPAPTTRVSGPRRSPISTAGRSAPAG